MKANSYAVILKRLWVEAFLKNHKYGCGYKRIIHDDDIEHEGKCTRAESWKKTFLGFTKGKRLLNDLYLKGAGKILNVF